MDTGSWLRTLVLPCKRQRGCRHRRDWPGRKKKERERGGNSQHLGDGSRLAGRLPIHNEVLNGLSPCTGGLTDMSSSPLQRQGYRRNRGTDHCWKRYPAMATVLSVRMSTWLALRRSRRGPSNSCKGEASRSVSASGRALGRRDLDLSASLRRRGRDQGLPGLQPGSWGARSSSTRPPG